MMFFPQRWHYNIGAHKVAPAGRWLSIEQCSADVFKQTRRLTNWSKARDDTEWDVSQKVISDDLGKNYYFSTLSQRPSSFKVGPTRVHEVDIKYIIFDHLEDFSEVIYSLNKHNELCSAYSFYPSDRQRISRVGSYSITEDYLTPTAARLLVYLHTHVLNQNALVTFSDGTEQVVLDVLDMLKMFFTELHLNYSVIAKYFELVKLNKEAQRYADEVSLEQLSDRLVQSEEWMVRFESEFMSKISAFVDFVSYTNQQHAVVDASVKLDAEVQGSVKDLVSAAPPPLPSVEPGHDFGFSVAEIEDTVKVVVEYGDGKKRVVEVTADNVSAVSAMIASAVRPPSDVVLRDSKVVSEQTHRSM